MERSRTTATKSIFSRNSIARATGLALLLAACLCALPPAARSQPRFELENNWLQWISFISGQDEGMERNLDDNFAWMQSQGYTHLRFFGIYPNGYHAFPSPTLDANGYPTDPLFESVLPVLTINLDKFVKSQAF